MGPLEHWENVYRTKATGALSWYRPHLETSLGLIERTGAGLAAAIIDVGGGESSLVDDLVGRGHQNITVLDLSRTALDACRARLGRAAESVRWLQADIVRADLPAQGFEVWHDRAVFHFLTDPEQRAAYVRQVAHAVKIGGHVIVGTFGLDGPRKCSGLEVARYDAASLHGQFGRRFRLMESATELHQTPQGVTQPFLYCYCRVE